MSMGEFVPVSSYRARFESVSGGAELIVPAKRNYFVLVFMTMWLCGWVFGEIRGGHLMFGSESMKGQSDPAFMIFWLAGWTFGGAFAVLTLLWNLAGLERIVVGNDEFLIRREIFRIGFGKRYELREVKDFRVVESSDPPGPFGMQARNPFGLGGGPFAFDYGAKTVRFGAGIDVAEAKHWRSRLLAAKPNLESR